MVDRRKLDKKKSERLQCRSSSGESNTAVSVTAVFQFKPTVTFLSGPGLLLFVGVCTERKKEKLSLVAEKNL